MLNLNTKTSRVKSGCMWAQVSAGTAALHGGRLSRDQRPALCRRAGSRQASAETGTDCPGLQGLRVGVSRSETQSAGPGSRTWYPAVRETR